MNAYLPFGDIELWHVAGWTMLHFLWLGMLAAIAAFLCRMLLRRASADVRYVAALACLAVLAAMPIGIAVWLVGQSPAVAVVDQIGPVTVQTGQFDQVPQTVIGSPSPRVATTQPLVELSGGDEEHVPAATGTARGPTGAVDHGPSSLKTTLAVAMLELAVPYLPWLWLAGTPITFALLATGLVGANRLRGVSRTIDDGPIAEACARLARALRVSRRVAVSACERIAAPVLVGIIRPIILLPPAAMTGWSPDEIEMVLLHELAHVRRWDNLVNLVQRIVESLLFFHPAVWLVSGWVRREREACCDAVVVGRTHRPHAYAEMLVAMAAQMPRSVFDRGRRRPGSLAAVSAIAAGPLRSRVRRILQLEDDPMLVSGKPLALATVTLLLVATLALLYLPSRGQAEESAKGVTENTGQKEATGNTEWTHEEEHHQQIQMQTAGGEQVTAESQNGRLRVQIRKRQTSGKFPSLDQQKLADLAWKRLHVELEPIGAEDLQRVKALGYDGGVKVTDVMGAYGREWKPNEIQPNDILVGLHVWPTRSLEDVAKVLGRNDLVELDPLKFYVVRRGRALQEQGQWTIDPELDSVVTGRIHVWLDEAPQGSSRSDSTKPRPAVAVADEAAEKGGAADAKPQAAVDAPRAADKSSLRYDGKTFDQWRDEWRNELSTQRRVEAVEALATFGASGYGKEAAEAILDVVKQYNWESFSSKSPVDQLKQQTIQTFTGQAFTGDYDVVYLGAEDWLPVLVAGVRSGNEQIVRFANLVFMRLNVRQANLASDFIELSREDDLKNIRRLLLRGLSNIYLTTHDPQIAERMTEVLRTGEPPEMIMTALKTLSAGSTRTSDGGMAATYVGDDYASGAEYRPELLSALEHGSPAVRQQVASVLGALGPKAEPAVPQLLPLVLDPNRDSAHAALWAVREITGSYQATIVYLNEVVEKDEDAEKVDRAKKRLKEIDEVMNWEKRQQETGGPRVLNDGSRFGVPSPSRSGQADHSPAVGQ